MVCAQCCNWSVHLSDGPGLWVLESYINWFENTFCFSSHHPSYSQLSPLTTIPTFDIMSSYNNVRPSLYVSTTPVDQEEDFSNAWNAMRANVRPALLEVSDIFQQSMLIVANVALEQFACLWGCLHPSRHFSRDG